MRSLVWFVPRGMLLISLVSIIGCAGGNKLPKPEMAPVSGKVTFKGAPLTDATVSFHPTGQQRSAVGKTDAQGQYQLSTIDNHDGAMPGDFQVTVEKLVDENAGEASTDIAAPRKQPKYKSLVPKKYGAPSSSGLTASVKQGSKNEIDFTLTE